MPERETMTDQAQPSSSDDLPLDPPRVGGETLSERPFVPTDIGPDLLGDAQPHADVPPVVGSAQPLAIGLADAAPVSGAGSSPTGRGTKVRIGDRIFGLMTSGASAIVIVIV